MSLKLSDYVTDYLIVLVGGNTLPNYVAIQLLTNQTTTIALVYSQGTETQKDNLIRALDRTSYANLIEREVRHESSPSSVRTAIHALLNDRLLLAGTTVGLHYTGGTKVMAAHAYLALREYREKQLAYRVYSYLDAYSLALWAERSDWGNSCNPITVGTAIPVSLQQILRLHNRQNLRQKVRQTPVWPDVAEQFAQFFADAPKKGREKWHNWCEQRFEVWEGDIQVEGLAKALTGLSAEEAHELAKTLALSPTQDLRDWRVWCAAHKFGHNCDSDQEKNALLQKALESKPFNAPDDAQSTNLFKRPAVQAHILGPLELATDLPLHDGATTFGQVVATKPWCDTDYPYMRLATWLNGGWLEEHLLAQLKVLEAAKIVHDCSAGIQPLLAGDRDFEFDVACMRGYQLFAFSCTTSNVIKLCKQKLLEAVARARQLGGSEARIALVCCLDQDKLSGLRGEIDALVRDNQVRLFGRDDLLALVVKIQEWIETIEQEAANALRI